MNFKIGDQVRVRSSKEMADSITFLNKSTINMYQNYGILTVYDIKNHDGEVLYCGREGRNMVALYSHWWEHVNKGCTCNFYDREVYGCRCGRIL